MKYIYSKHVYPAPALVDGPDPQMNDFVKAYELIPSRAGLMDCRFI